MDAEVANLRDGLAILGGSPVFSTPLHVGQPNLGDRDAFLARVGDMLDRRWFTNDGPYVLELEKRLADEIGVEHCVAVCNGTTALRLTAQAAGLVGEVLIPSFTFVATAHALAMEGLVPVFCDVDPVSWNLDPEACEAAITPATSAILGVHLFGRPCDIEHLSEIAERRGLQLLFDAAHAFGCTHAGRPIGSFGSAEVFSFHATKAFHTFEGGCVATNRGDLAEQVRLLRNFGFWGFDDVSTLGTNGKMPEVCAAMELSNLERFSDLVDANRLTHNAYLKGLEGIPGLRPRPYNRLERHNWHYTVLEVKGSEFGLSRDELLQVLSAENVLARRYFFPGVHAMEPYRTWYPGAASLLPRTLDAASRVLVLPAGQGVAADKVALVCDIVREASARAGEIRSALDCKSGT